MLYDAYDNNLKFIPLELSTVSKVARYVSYMGKLR